jgi:CheY-like chemotaxis protein
MPRNLHLSKTVLLVDDLDTLRKMIREFLGSLGMEVLEASNATEAIHIGRSHPGRIDLLLTDLEMPGMSGWESATFLPIPPQFFLGHYSSSSLKNWEPIRRGY